MHKLRKKGVEDLNNIFRFLESFYFPKITFLDIIEIVIIIILVYQIQKSLKNTSAWMIFKGIIILVIVYLCSSILNLSVIQYIFQSAISLNLIANPSSIWYSLPFINELSLQSTQIKIKFIKIFI